MDILAAKRQKHRTEGPRKALGPSQEEGLFEGERGVGGDLGKGVRKGRESSKSNSLFKPK